MLFGDLQAHKIKLKFEFLGFAVMSQQFDATAKPKNHILALFCEPESPQITKVASSYPQ